MKNNHLQGRLSFQMMSLEFRIRDLIRPPIAILKEAGLRPGMTVLDFGCGPGGFSLAAARLVGPEGRVYALDLHPLAIRSIERAAAKKRVHNLIAVAGAPGRFADHCFDAVLLYDVLHDLPDPDAVLREMFRILKPAGFLSVRDHHLEAPKILGIITVGGLFRPAERGRRTLQFQRHEARV